MPDRHAPLRPRRRSGALACTTTALLLAACSGTSTGTGTGNAAASTASTAAPSGTGPSGTGSSGSTPNGTATSTGSGSPSYVVFNGQGNNLDVYEPEPPFTSQRLITTAAKDEENGLDINAQICFFPDGSNRFVAGEDTDQSPTDLQGWGIFELSGSKVGSFSVEQVAKLVPTYQGSADNAENYGCGFLKDGRIVTTDVGAQALGPATGQLIVWFPPFDSEKVAFCKIDTHIATAQSIYVDDEDHVYVAASRPGESETDTASGVYRYDGPFPTSDDAAGGCGKTDDTGAPLADTVTKTKVIAATAELLSPAGLAPTGTGTIYVSSVATGVINEYELDGTFVRTILKPAEGESLDADSIPTGTPLGIGVGPDGTVFFADIGVVNDGKGNIGPGDNNGSVRRITFEDGKPQPPETLASGLAFPDGIGIWVPK